MRLSSYDRYLRKYLYARYLNLFSKHNSFASAKITLLDVFILYPRINLNTINCTRCILFIVSFAHGAVKNPPYSNLDLIRALYIIRSTSGSAPHQTFLTQLIILRGIIHLYAIYLACVIQLKFLSRYIPRNLTLFDDAMTLFVI